MTYKDIDSSNWRNDSSLVKTIRYKRRWAFLPVVLNTGEKLWAKSYYTKYETYGHGDLVEGLGGEGYGHTDVIENINEAEYIVRKLSENL